MSKLTKRTYRPPASEQRVEINVIARREGKSRKALRNYCRIGLAIRNGKPKQRGIRLKRAILEHDPQMGATINTSWEAWERFVAKINPGE